MKDELLTILHNLRDLPGAQPRERFVQNARIRVLNLSGLPSHTQTVQSWTARKLLEWAGFLAGGLLTTSTALVYGAQYSVPGGALYPVKIASENAAISLIPGTALRTEIATSILDSRANQITASPGTSSEKDHKQAIDDYNDFVARANSNDGINKTELERHIKEHSALFDKSDRRDSGKNTKDDEPGDRTGNTDANEKGRFPVNGENFRGFEDGTGPTASPSVEQDVRSTVLGTESENPHPSESDRDEK